MTLEEMYGNAKALVEDRTYNIGEISEKTGLQKTANGWVKPKSNKGAKKDASGADVLNNENYKDDVRTAEGEAKIVSQMDTKGIQRRINELEALKKQNGGELGIYGERELKIKKAELEKRSSKSRIPQHLEEVYPMNTDITKEEKNEAMKNPKTRLSQKYDEVIKSKKGTPQYNTALEEYTKERESYENSQGVEALKEFPVVPISKDSACRITADTKIRLKK